ncbi:cyclic nucleotide-binding domain-containing protein [Candidatus Poribacteria bacterium]|nr:cyclic nucleotide-binding domain-containing protein [Candidatus Poribacteria bacterium]
MKLFEGIPSQQVKILRHSGAHRHVPAGEMVFREGDPAYGLFTVISGLVEFFRDGQDGRTTLGQAGPGDVFGEMGLLRDSGLRTASARAVDETIVFEISPNPIETLHRLEEDRAALVLLQNLICILGERLRRKDAPDAPRIREDPREALVREHSGRWANMPAGRAKAIERIEASLPKGMFRRFLAEKTLEDGAYLCRQGGQPDGFYFLRSGVIEVFKEEGGEPRRLSEMNAPSIAGEVGFFAGEPRSASLRAFGEVQYTHFSADDFRKLREKSPREAFDVLFAVAQLIVCLILERESIEFKEPR